jgi:hypothetical protein
VFTARAQFCEVLHSSVDGVNTHLALRCKVRKSLLSMGVTLENVMPEVKRKLRTVNVRLDDELADAV